MEGKKNLKEIFKNISATALKSYIKLLLYIFFKKFEKVEKLELSPQKTPSVILGFTVGVTV